MELENFQDSNYDLIEYIIMDEKTKRPVHKKINVKFMSDLHGRVINHKVYGTWRVRGFWTANDFPAEKAIAEIISKIDTMIRTGSKMSEVKEYVFKQMEKVVAENEEMKNLSARLGSSSAYGADHDKIRMNPLM